MSFLTGSPEHSWEPVMTGDTTAPCYWLNWRFSLCALWILTSLVASAAIIWRYEGSAQKKDRLEEKTGILYRDEAWKTSSKRIHPVWLLVYRVIGFCLLLAALIADVAIHSAGIFYYYTEWTFTLVTVYFGLASIFSIHGCLYECKEARGVESVESDAERGTYVAPTLEDNENVASTLTYSSLPREPTSRKVAGAWGYVFQIIFQTCAGAVVLTDAVFWFILYPFLVPKNYRLDFMKVCMHSLNAIVLLGDVTLNGMRFPFFRVAYFMLWTSLFVIFQWVIHACVFMWWPYPFLDLSSPYAPAWYLAVGLFAVPCYGIFALIVRIKKCCWSRNSSV